MWLTLQGKQSIPLDANSFLFVLMFCVSVLQEVNSTRKMLYNRDDTEIGEHQTESNETQVNTAATRLQQHLFWVQGWHSACPIALKHFSTAGRNWRKSSSLHPHQCWLHLLSFTGWVLLSSWIPPTGLQEESLHSRENYNCLIVPPTSSPYYHPRGSGLSLCPLNDPQAFVCHLAQHWASGQSRQPVLPRTQQMV